MRKMRVATAGCGVPFLLRRLEITGFKSFARQMCLELTPGITAFVGPNGSGKSNVVDAMRWCLGEQSSRDLRGQRAEDVIHAGRQRVLGLAEVTLTFEPADEDAERERELCLARRLYRSGESEYLIDGRRTRLRDLTAALKRVEIDAGRHVVVNQGMADAWLTTTPVERRALIEQAAGLTLYRERRDEAMHKLSQTQRNIETIEAVVAEIEPRTRLLRRQARAVQDRDEAAKLLRDAQMRWYAHRWSAMTGEARVAREEGARLSDVRSLANHRLAAAERRAETQAVAYREWRTGLDERVQRLHSLERERDMAAANVMRTRDSARMQARLRDDLENRLTELLEARDDAARRRLEAQRNSGDVELELAAVQIDDAAQISSVVEVERQTRDRESACVQMQRQELEAQRERNQILDEIRHLEQVDASDVDFLERAQSWLDQRIPEAGAWRNELTDAERQMSDATLACDRLREQSRAAQHDLDQGTQRLERVRGLARRLRGDAEEVDRRIAIARRELRSLGERDGGTIVASLEVDAGWEDAIASALGVWAYARTDAGGSVYLRRYDQLGFRRWRDSLAGGIPSPLWAEDVVRGAPGDHAHPLAATLLVETEIEAEHAWGILQGGPGLYVSTPPVQIVSREGVCWTAHGVRGGASRDDALRWLEEKGRLTSLRDRNRTLISRLAGLESAEKAAARADSRARGSASAGAAGLREAEARLSRGAGSVVTLQKRLAVFDLERSAREAESAAKQAPRGARETRLGHLKARADDIGARLIILVSKVEETRAAWDEAARKERHVRQEIAQGLTRLEVLEARLTSHRQISAAAERDLNRIVAQRLGVEEQLRAVDADRGGGSAREKEEQKVFSEIDERVLTARRDVEASRSAEPRRTPLLDVAPLRASVSSAIAEHERALAHVARLEEDRGAFGEELRLDLAIATRDLPSPSGEQPPAEDIRRLRIRATQYADVDLDVVAEYTALEERRVNLERNLEDLRGACGGLREVMDIADVEMGSRFDHAFAAVSEEFGRVFTIMLPGGEAGLETVPETGGIEIRARLPGRRARSSASFSGGEKALIASALLFGVLRIRPTPFCILDEVDAALDESNVDRFLGVLRDISRNTQVIVVTHNRATMAAADVLYGLTMDADGVSRVLSLKLDSYAAG
ncbi:MAG: hypothetical protein DLM70_00160 [Chloroflexi bacterium]|nr:MAG: hypothetical protein DLM70_00160 [Chloroflexota bacterium]